MTARSYFWLTLWAAAFLACALAFGPGAAVAGVLCSALALAGRGGA